MRSNLIFSVLSVFLNTVFPLIVFPYLARVLGAEGLGTYNYYNLTITYISLFTSFGISIYGVKEVGKYKEDAVKRSQVAVELLSFNLINAILFFIAIMLFSLNTQYRADIDVIMLLSATLICNALGVEWFFVAIEYQKYILIRSFFVKLISIICIFYFVRNQDDLIKYIIIVITGIAIPSFVNFKYFLKHISISSCKRINLKRHFRPLFLIFIVEISIRYFGMIDVFILGLKESKTIVGYYSLALNVFLIISSFIRISAVTLLPRAAFYLNEKEWEKFSLLINNTIKFILFIGIPSSIALYIWSDLIVLILGGSAFIYSTTLLKYFSFLIILSSLINMLVFQVLYPLNQAKNIAIAFFGGIGINLFLNWILIPVFSAKGVVIASIVSQVVVLLVLVFMNKKYFWLSFFSKDMFKYLYSGLILSLCSLSIHALWGSRNIIIQIVLGALVYFGSLIILKENIFINFALKWIKNEES